MKNISDDIIVCGTSTAEHDRRLDLLLCRLVEKGLTVNTNKCEFNKTSVEYYGHVFSRNGISPSPAKVEAVRQAGAPSNPDEVRSLIGFAQYTARFIPNFATLTEPLRDLTKQDTPWQWGERESNALCDLKESLTSDPVMAYFDLSRDTEIYCDASPVGLGAVLIQRDRNNSRNTHIVAFASRALSATEQKYPQIDREALAIVWAVSHFHLYVYGSEFVVVTDHKPLEAIWNNPRSKLSARLEKWTLRLQAYNFTIRYEPGRNNPADWMSRHPVGKSQDTTSQIDEYINFVISHTVPKAMSVEEVRQETSVDPLMQEVIKRIELGNWNDPTDDPDLRSFRNIHAELSCLDNVVLRGTRLVLPRNLQHRAVNLAHEGHQGIVKTKSLLREKVWFPGIDKMAEETVKRCIPCQATGPDPAPEPLRMSELPRGPWLVVAADFKGPYGPSNEYVLVLTDEYSRYPVTRIVRSTAAVTVIPVVDELLSMFGIPDVLKTDNGSPFNSDDFYKYSKHVGFHHRRITPEWPRANSEVERFMTNINKVVQTALIEEKTWKQELHTFLRSYCATPHTTSGSTPYELLFGRSMHVKLPEFPDFPAEDFALRRRDQQAKRTQKDYSDSKRHVKASNIHPGDSVLVKRRQLSKMMSRFDPEPYEVTDVKGPMITAQSPGGRVITRNSSFMKAVPTPAEPSVPPVVERTWPSPERPGPASMACPPGAHSLSPMARPPGAPPSPSARPLGAPPQSPLARPRWSPPGQSTHVPSPRFEPETPESSLDSGTRPPDSNRGYSLRCRASVKTPGYLKDYVPWWFND